MRLRQLGMRALRPKHPATNPNMLLQKLEKKIPDQPTNVTPVELRTKQIFADVRIGPGDGKPFVAGQEEAKQ